MAGDPRGKFRLKCFHPLSCCPSRGDERHEQIGQRGYSRVVYCNDLDNPEAIRLNYGGNYVSTTKYTLLNFFPKSLFEQFRRVANVYFLVVACVSFTPLAPFKAVSIVAPLALVIGVTMLKEAVEDWGRFRQDVEANNHPVEVFDQNRGFCETRWKNIRVGDIVRVYRDSYFPADLLLLSSSYEDGICYVETMNLDGETNLKVKQCLEMTASINNEESLREFRAIIKCEDPNEKLYTFVGKLCDDGIEHPLSLRQLLLRDSKLKNTDYIYGVVVFTGHDTKVMRNATNPRSKRSKIEKKMDKLIYFLFYVLISISLLGSIFFGIQTKEDLSGGRYKRWYLRPDNATVFFDPSRAALAAFFHFLTDLMLYGYFIPISLYISVEIVKVLQSIFINKDRDMYHQETNRLAQARTSNLNEELGQVDIILSDKTGTLTCNSLEFVKCSIAGIAYGYNGEMEVERDGPPEASEISNDVPGHDGVPVQRAVKRSNFRDERIMNGRWVDEPNAKLIQTFFRALAVCHTVVPDVDKASGEIIYDAESPDEAALVIAARELGFKVSRRTEKTVELLEMNYKTGISVRRIYELLHVLEFSSARRRMSVVVRSEENELLLFCKGADSVMFERLSEDGRHFEAKTNDHIKKFSQTGLRVMVIAYRELRQEEYSQWEEKFLHAKTTVSVNPDTLDAAMDEIERELILLGAAGIEDKLQDGVPECIERLAQAGIELWVLTGDKLETAVNIGYACRLLREQMTLIEITLEQPEITALERQGDKKAISEKSFEIVQGQLEEGKSQLAKESSGEFGLVAGPKKREFGLVIDGKSLDYVLQNKLEESFLKLANECASVICCRSSPKQKALVTRWIKSKKGTGGATLCIGDGANDVSMLQEADIGVGISGMEGMQAVMASDFAIAEFRFLERLLLVHGHWCYRRIAMMICYFFYKNITFGFTLFWFEAYASFSAQPAYNDWYMSLYNVIFTSLPVIALGVFDQDVSAALCLENPRLYEEGRKNILFNWSRILGWMANGVGCSIIIFFCTTNAIINQAFRKDGQVADYEILGVTMYTCIVWTVNCQMALSINYFTWIQHIFIWGSIAFWYIFLMVYGFLSPAISTTAYMVLVEGCIPSILYWLTTILVVISALLPYFSYRAFQSQFQPMPHDRLQRKQLVGCEAETSRDSQVDTKDQKRHVKENLTVKS